MHKNLSTIDVSVWNKLKEATHGERQKRVCIFETRLGRERYARILRGSIKRETGEAGETMHPCKNNQLLTQFFPDSTKNPVLSMISTGFPEIYTVELR